MMQSFLSQKNANNPIHVISYAREALDILLITGNSANYDISKLIDKGFYIVNSALQDINVTFKGKLNVTIFGIDESKGNSSEVENTFKIESNKCVLVQKITDQSVNQLSINDTLTEAAPVLISTPFKEAFEKGKPVYSTSDVPNEYIVIPTTHPVVTKEYSIEDDKFYQVIAENDIRTKVIFKKAHGFIFPVGRGSIKIQLLDDVKVYKELSFVLKDESDQNRLKFFDAGKYTMTVTIEPSENQGVGLYCTLMQTTKRIFGVSKYIDISLKNSETALVLMASSDNKVMFDIQQSNLIFEPLHDVPLGGPSMNPVPLENVERTSVAGIFKVESGKNSGNVVVKSNSNIQSISSYIVGDTPLYAKGQMSGYTLVNDKTEENGSEDQNSNAGGVNRSGSNTGMIVGIVIAVVAVVAIISVFSFMAVKKKGCFANNSEKSIIP